MAVGQDLADCLGIDVEAFDVSAFVNIMTGFLELPTKLINPVELIKILPDLGNPPKLILAPVRANIPLPLGEVDLGLDVFGPEGLIDFVTGLGNIALGIPDLFGLPKLEIKDGKLDIPGLTLELTGPPPPVPKPPSLEALISLVALSIGLTAPNVNAEFPAQFAECLAGIIAVPLGLKKT